MDQSAYQIQQAYHEIRSLQFKIADYDTQIKNASTDDVKSAYSTIQAVYVSSLTVMNANFISTISGSVQK
jgi:hypothetical protein